MHASGTNGPAGTNALSSSVLVLNRFYMAVHVINVRRALGLLLRELAEVIHLEEGQYANYDFALVARNQRAAGRLQGAGAARGLDPGDQFRAAGAASHPAAVLRSDSAADDPLQPPQHFCPRRQSMPILRPAFSDQRVEPRPCDAAQPRRRHLLGEHRLRVRGVQREKRGPHAARGPYQADPPAGPPETQPAADREARQSQVRKLEDVLGQCLLVGGFEIARLLMLTALQACRETKRQPQQAAAKHRVSWLFGKAIPSPPTALSSP